MKVNWLYQATLECDTPILVQSGGSSSSKTYSILQALLTIASTEKDRVITIVGQDIPNLKKGAIRDTMRIISDTPFFQQQITNHNRSSHTYEFITGSLIEFTSYSDEQDAKNGKRTHCFLNEANGIGYGIFEQLRIRTSELMVIDFNPSGEFWAHTKLLGRNDVTWINSNYKDNSFINPTVLKSILSYEPTPENIARGTANKYRWDVYGLGKLGKLEGLVFENFELAHEWPELPKWTIYGLDFGYTNDPTALIEVSLHKGELWLRQLIYETGLTNQAIAERMKSFGFTYKQRVIADSAEPKSIDEIRLKGLNILPAVKGKDSVLHGIDLMKRYKINIHGGSRDLINEFNQYQWQKDKDGSATNKPVDKYNHAIDAVRYACLEQLGKDIINRKALNTISDQIQQGGAFI